MEDRQAKLARMYIEEFLHSKGLTEESVHKLEPATAKQIWIEASTYAALKLAEIEGRAGIVRELHGDSDA